MLLPNEKEQLEELEAYVVKILSGDKTGHDMDHIYRVVRLAEELAMVEPCSLFIVKAGAYLHDVIDDKLIKDEEEAYQNVVAFLKKIEVDETKIQQILHVIANTSFSKQVSQDKDSELSMEAKIVQDADRLDAMGAIGVVRAAYYGGSQGHKIHEPERMIQQFETKEAYRKGSTVINHFYEKLLKLQDGLHTDQAKKIGKKRHDFLILFLEEFLAEWDEGVK